MKKIPTGIACALLLCATGVTAQVPRVLGIWEFDPQASGLPKPFRSRPKRAATICATTVTWSTW